MKTYRRWIWRWRRKFEEVVALVTNAASLAIWPATAVKVEVMVAVMLVEVGSKSSCFFFGQ